MKDEAHAIVGCAMEVLNGIGHGLHEKPYENALTVEFRYRQIPFSQQPRFPVVWRKVKVGEFIPDLIAFDKVIIDTKTVERITDHERGQMLNYLRITNLPLGLIINFKHRRLQWERVVLTKSA
ncbi:MAG: GxxExxY protein [Verrucomicrobiota bacterium]